LGKLEYYGLDYWLPEFEKWHKDSPSNRQAEVVWQCVNQNRGKLEEIIRELDQAGAQTVVHGDLQLDNILFRAGENQDELYVIDWTQPHISSVTKDLASLYDNAPPSIKMELIQMYKKYINFDHFDDIFRMAKVLRDIGYLCWMAWMINDGHKDEIAQSELDRVAASLLISLDNHWDGSQ